jgi:hypothetical protein
LYLLSSVGRHRSGLGCKCVVPIVDHVDVLSPIFVVTDEFLFVSRRFSSVVDYFFPCIIFVMAERWRAMARDAIRDWPIEAGPATRIVSLEEAVGHFLFLDEEWEFSLIESIDRV